MIRSIKPPFAILFHPIMSTIKSFRQQQLNESWKIRDLHKILITRLFDCCYLQPRRSEGPLVVVFADIAVQICMPCAAHHKRVHSLPMLFSKKLNNLSTAKVSHRGLDIQRPMQETTTARHPRHGRQLLARTRKGKAPLSSAFQPIELDDLLLRYDIRSWDRKLEKLTARRRHPRAKLEGRRQHAEVGDRPWLINSTSTRRSAMPLANHARYQCFGSYRTRRKKSFEISSSC